MVKSIISKYLKFIVLTILLLNISCTKYNKLLKSKDYALKLEKAIEYYEKKDWHKAETLFTDILPVYRGTDKAKDIMLMYAYCHYNLGDNLIAVHYFKTFSRTWSNDPRVKEADFMVAICLYEDSPRFNLDQTSSIKAIEAFQYYITMHPTSERIEEATDLQENLKKRLEKKSYSDAKQYFQLGQNKAAVISLKNSLKDFPDSEYREDIMFLILKSSFMLARNSQLDVKKERFQDTINEYYAYIDEFATGTRAKEAERIYAQCVKELQK